MRCERDKVRTKVDIHTLMRESSIMRQNIRDILISFDSGLIYQHVSKKFEMRREQVESVEDKMNVPFTLSFSSCLALSRRECKPGIRGNTDIVKDENNMWMWVASENIDIKRILNKMNNDMPCSSKEGVTCHAVDYIQIAQGCSFRLGRGVQCMN